MRYYYFDMDGVLAVFEQHGKMRLEDKPFMRPGSHYFLHRMPDYRAVEIFERMLGPDCPYADVNVLTRLAVDGREIPEELLEEWRTDKIAWLLSSTTGFDPGRKFFVSDMDKSYILSGVPIRERRNHILIDDLNRNLNDWVKAGGTAVKYQNDLNSPDSFDGLCLLKDWTVERCVHALLTAGLESAAGHQPGGDGP